MKLQGLYGLALARLKECKGNNDIIKFPDIFSKLCTGFSIRKKDCWELLFLFRDMGFIEIICGHGIKFKS